jgi:hypothetical protein
MSWTLERMIGRTFAGRCLPGIAALALGAGLASTAVAQSSPQLGTPEASGDESVTPESIFERHIEVIGGRGAVFNIRNRVISGTYEGDPFKFPARLRIIGEAPNKMVWEAFEPAGQGVRMVYNGELGWREASTGVGPTQNGWIIGPPLVDLVEAADFWGESNYKERYVELELLGTTDFYGTTCYAVRGVRREGGKNHVLMFSIQSGLFVGSRTAVLHASGESRPLDVRLENYEEFGGVLYPTRMVQQFRGDTTASVFEFSRVRVNVDEQFNWNPPVEMPPYPKLDENFMPIVEDEAAGEP